MNFLVLVIFIFLEKIIPLFPMRILYPIVKFKAKLFYYLLPIRKKTAYLNLKMVFPHKSDSEIQSIIKKSYFNILTAIVEFFYLPKLTDKQLSEKFVISNENEMKEKFKNGKGIVFVSAHFGNWEIMAFGGALIFGKPLSVIVKEQSNRRLDRRLNTIREKNGNIMIEMKRATREVIKALGENRIVAMLGDQSAPAESSKVKFFGQEITAFDGPAVFALKTGAPIFWGAPVRDNNYNYSLKAIEVDTSIYSEYSAANVQEITQKTMSLLEDHITKYPDHWLWFHRRFKSLITYD